MRIYLFLIVVCGAAACGSPVQQPKVQVSGQATMKVVPDMVELSLKAFNVRPAIKGYSAQQILEVRLKNIKQIEPFTEELLATRINSIESIRYNHSKADSIQRVVNLMALADAQKTAEKMCEKMNVHLGKVIYMSNYSPNGEREASVSAWGGESELNLYSKSFGGRGFKMTAEILEFQDVAFAGFELQ